MIHHPPERKDAAAGIIAANGDGTDRASLAGAGSGIGVKVDSKAGRGTAGLLVMAQGGFLDGSPAKSSTS